MRVTLFTLISLLGCLLAINLVTVSSETTAQGDMTTDDGMMTGDYGHDDDDDDDDDDYDKLPISCCPKKKVGYSVYKLIAMSKVPMKGYGCDSPCVYKKIPQYMVDEWMEENGGDMKEKRSRRRKRSAGHKRVRRAGYGGGDEEGDDKMEDMNKWYCFKMTFEGGYPSQCYWDAMDGHDDDKEDMTTHPDMTTPPL